MGHGMRRRTGSPSSYTEMTGNSMARMHQTHHEAVEDASAAGSHRIAMGTNDPSMVSPDATMTSVDETNQGQFQGTLVPKKGVQAMDPTGAGSKQNRQNIEVIGASYRIAPKSTFVQLDPSAGPTMASARIIPSVAGTNNAFQDASNTSYL